MRKVPKSCEPARKRVRKARFRSNGEANFYIPINGLNALRFGGVKPRKRNGAKFEARALVTFRTVKRAACSRWQQSVARD